MGSNADYKHSFPPRRRRECVLFVTMSSEIRQPAKWGVSPDLPPRPWSLTAHRGPDHESHVRAPRPADDRAAGTRCLAVDSPL